MRLTKRNNGFTLVELLVGMALFIILTTIVVTLFQGSVVSVRQGYQVDENFEMGRSTLETMARDLQAAVSGKDFGALYTFYGRPEGFTFIYTSENGTLARVTYAVLYDAGPDPGEGGSPTFNQYPTEMMVTLKEIKDAAYKRGGYLFTYNQMARNRFIAHNIVNEAQASGYFYDLAENTFNPGHVYPDNYLFEDLRVVVRTYPLIRYEEPATSELDTFDMTDKILWPYLDPVNPDLDAMPDPAYFDMTHEQLRFNDCFLSALWPNRGDSFDLRYEMEAALTPQMSGFVYPLEGLDSGAIEQFIAARKREIWVRTLSGTLGEIASPRYDSEGYDMPISWWAMKGLDWKDFVIAKSVAGTAWVCGSGGDIFYDEVTGLPVADLFFEPGMFAYGNGEITEVEVENSVFSYNPTLSPVFNDTGNIWWWNTWVACQTVSPDYPEVLTEFFNLDLKIAELYTKRQDQSRVFGSPVVPAMPANLSVRFWVLDERSSPSSSDFRQLFTQMLDIPVGSRRASPETLTPPGT